MDVTPTHVSDPYLVLGVRVDASQAEIVHAFRQRVRELHPDTGVADPEGRFRAVIAAYGVLSDPDRRAAVDRSRRPRVRPGSTKPTTPMRRAVPFGFPPPSAEPPLRIGPVHHEPLVGRPDDEFGDVATLARMIARRLRPGGWPW
jgi:curved DNA-binding protein CbpA